ncbi:glycoside hydrolase family 2 protein [Rhizomonospora bruguierae]|uniref:glycoside hydrolase family 2 protein n=1 Tax=Rhizomonospora bruguierae TaxID=1581705 RepID=UPI001BCCADE1|nr:glycoside hydrolase family 2 protein [Micromonospora sp. NBRC 107566]
MSSYRPLHDGWTVAPALGAQLPAAASVGRVAATVPGCVHTDLLAAGRIPDPFLDDNEVGLGWIGRTDWVYETTFDWQPAGDDRVDLVCAGLDTVATVALNGTEVGHTANMHRGYRFDVAALLRPGANDLRVRFDSAYRYTQRLAEELGDRPAAYREPFNFIRKMACNFGWDWGPTLVTAGIWQQIGLHAWSGARLAEVRPLVGVDGADGRVEVHVRVERAADGPLPVAAEVAGVRAVATIAPGETAAVLALTVPGVRRWWPRGYGDQPLYDLTVTLGGGDTWSRRIGFRTVRLDTTPDPHGTPYTLVVNDVPVFVRGVNWIPDDVFVTRITRERLAGRFAQARAANVNYLRIWGGGRYESEDFYDLADELGLLVGQDFLFACAAYPEEEPLATEVAAEAREQVVRLASHPSLVTWTGNNENIWGREDWGWREQLGDRTWGAGYYFELLPAIVAELDPTRPYWPGSPYSGSRDIHPNDPAHGTMHIWDVWNTDDYTRYAGYSPRFVAEFGYQAPPAYATLRRALSDDPLAVDSPGMRHHQKAVDGDAKLQRGLDGHLPPPRDFDDWHYLTQLNQARAIELAVERYRAQQPVCMGTIVWQLNDCWPVTSWSAVDGDGRRKPLWYALRRLYADRLLTIQPHGAGLALVAVNEAGTAWRDPVTVTRVSLAGEPLAKTAVDLAVEPRSARVVPLPAEVGTAGDPRAELLVADAGEERLALRFFAEDKDVAYPQAAYDAAVEPTDGGTRVTVTARTILRDLTLFPDRLDPAAEVDRALVTLLPGESVTFGVTGAVGLDPVALTSRPVLRCVNDLPAGGA